MRTAQEIAQAIDKEAGKPNHRGFVPIRCPFHDDEVHSAAIIIDEYGWPRGKCQRCGATKEQFTDLFKREGLWPENNGASKQEKPWKLVDHYDYQDEYGNIVLRKKRWLQPNGKKTFTQHKHLGNGKFDRNRGDVKTVLYRLPKVVQAAKDHELIFLTEGEKDVHTCESLGLIATTSPDGGGEGKEKWKESYTDVLIGVQMVYLFTDNDAAGKIDYPLEVLPSLLKAGVPATLINLPGLEEKEDITDWINKGNTIENLIPILMESEPVTQETIALLQQQKAAASNKRTTKAKPDESRIDNVKASREKSDLEKLTSGWSFFKTPDGKPYCRFDVDGHKETWLVKSNQTASRIRFLFYEKNNQTLPENQVEKFLDQLESFALFGKRDESGVLVPSAVQSVHLRVADLDNVVYHDLCDAQWRIVRIDRSGWDIIDSRDTPVLFHRTAINGCLPEPVKGGSLYSVKRFLSLADDDFKLWVGCTIADLLPKVQHPIMATQAAGEDSGKTSTAAARKHLIDPGTDLNPIRNMQAFPKSEEDLYVMAMHNYVLAFDNVSAWNRDQQDWICRLTNGCSFQNRKFYENQGLNVMSAGGRPVIVSSIERVTKGADTASRTISLSCQRINDDRRMEETAFCRAFNDVRPEILGAIYDAVSAALGCHQAINLKQKPRLADMAKWVTAAEQGYLSNLQDWGDVGKFCELLRINRKIQIEMSVESDELVQGIMKIMQTDFRPPRDLGRYHVIDLLSELKLAVSDDFSKSNAFPKANTLRDVLGRRESALRHLGVIYKSRTNDDRRMLLKLATNFCDGAGDALRD